MNFISVVLKKRYWVFLLSLFIIAAAVAVWFVLQSDEPGKPSEIPLGDYSYTIDYVDYQVNELMKEHDLPSVVIALIDEQDVIYKKAYGLSDIESNTPATLDTIYKIGSITKVFTGLEVMRMVEEGLIDLDAPITEYIPEFSIHSKFSDSGPITIRSILSHRSGLPRGGTLLGWYWESSPDVLEALTLSLADSYQVYPVGYRYKYSNIGYNVLGRIIEVRRGIEPPVEESVGGWPYYMKEAFLDPLEMNDTGFGSDLLLYGRDSENDIAMGYYVEDGRNKPYNQFEIIHLASGNMQSTMNDMIKFTRYLINIDEAGDEANGIIAGDTLRSMYEEQYARPRDPQTNGLTWFTDRKLLGEQVVFHSGSNQGVNSLLMFMPERKLGMVVISNSDAFKEVQNQLAIDILRLLFETKYGIVHQEEPVETVVVNTSILERYVGKFVINGEIIEIILSGDQLKANYRNNKVKMAPITDSRFRLSHPLVDVEDIELEFFVDSPNEEDILIVYMGDYFICPRYPDIEGIPLFWEELKGTYEIYPRIPSTYSDTELIGTMDIYIEDNVLFTTGGMVLSTTSDNEITITGGVFGGETMIYDEETGYLTWQHLIYKPVNE